MWEHLKVLGSLDSVITAVKNGTAIWCTDGSFDRVVMPSISSAGWVVFDPKTKHHLRGAFYEDSGPYASAYRGELLGITALHLVASAMAELYGKPASQNTMYCDNQRALEKAKWHRRRISPATKHSDLLRLLRNIKFTTMGMFKYVHIYGHADKKRKWKDLSLPEQVNVYCDYLAGVARKESIHKTRDRSTQTLPRETAALFLHSVKQTGDISEPIRFFLARTQARNFYVNDLKWSGESFDEVDWDALNLTLSKKNKMFTLWLAKQASSFCGTRLQVSRMTEGGADDRCPNCLAPEERAQHLNVCPSVHRTKQFLESVKELEDWLCKDNTHPEIAFWVPLYLKARGRERFENLVHYRRNLIMSSQMKMVAVGQDRIGWHHFLEGKITGHFRGMQQLYLKSRPSRINADDWVKQFIYKLVKITHAQWIFWNLTLHDRQYGHLAMLRRETLAEEMERLHALAPEEVPEESRFLLDFDPEDLAEGDISTQEHWILAMRAARIAGMRTRGRRVQWAKMPRHDPPSQPFRSKSVEEALRDDLFGSMDKSTTNKRPSEASLSLDEPSNKRRRRRKKPDSDVLVS